MVLQSGQIRIGFDELWEELVQFDEL